MDKIMKGVVCPKCKEPLEPRDILTGSSRTREYLCNTYNCQVHNVEIMRVADKTVTRLTKESNGN